jgi:hypothetical protein
LKQKGEEMSTKQFPTGNWAFPTGGGSSAQAGQTGMPLRIYLAGQAVSGAINSFGTVLSVEKISEYCLKIADAILAQERG